ncbi:MAG: hypothetical protein KZQ58_13445 [gamma proteobacterium symbiont of Bathyaustriella thionipta]|nr:hypothetical protein [gamma proteobacterium symbiont of Bathyaustriella thionipta]
MFDGLSFELVGDSIGVNGPATKAQLELIELHSVRIVARLKIEKMVDPERVNELMCWYSDEDFNNPALWSAEELWKDIVGYAKHKHLHGLMFMQGDSVPAPGSSAIH